MLTLSRTSFESTRSKTRLLIPDQLGIDQTQLILLSIVLHYRPTDRLAVRALNGPAEAFEIIGISAA